MFETITSAHESDRYQLKLRDILEQAATLFAQNGYHNTSIRDLAREMKTSLAGLYYYFETKEELLYLISKYAFDTVLHSVRQQLSPAMTPEEKLTAFVQNHLQYFVTHLDAMKVMAHESDSLTGRYFQEINEKKRAYLDLLEEILSELQRKYDPSSRGHDVVKIAALSLFGMMNWTHTWYNTNKSEHSPSNITRIGETMTKLFLQGFQQTIKP